MLFDGSIPTTPVLPQQNEVSVTGEVNAARPRTVLHLASGRTVMVPTELLLGGPAEVSSVTPVRPEGETYAVENSAPEYTIPIVEEQVQIGKRTVTTGTVRLHKGTESFTQTVGLPITRTGWEVERTPIGQLYDERPEVRQEGEITVFPLVEERLVAKREYFLIEEVRVRRVETTTERTTSVELKRDVLTVEREAAVNTVTEG